jgi:tetratricopeptide (TPR) repeat protein
MSLFLASHRHPDTPFHRFALRPSQFSANPLAFSPNGRDISWLVMEPTVTQSTDWYKLWAWAETNRRQVAMAVGGIVVVGLIAWFVIWHKEAKEISAGEAVTSVAVSQMLNGPERIDAEPFLKAASEYPNTAAGIRASLLAAGNLFVEGKYDQARAQFEKFIREHGDSPMVGQAYMGVGATYDAQGKTGEAIAAYKKLTEGHSTDPAVPQARFSLARLYEAQNNPALARAELEQTARDQGSVFAQEAAMRLQELEQKFPTPAPPSQTAFPQVQIPPTSTATPVIQAPSSVPLTSAPVIRAPRPSSNLPPIQLEKK